MSCRLEHHAGLRSTIRMLTSGGDDAGSSIASAATPAGSVAVGGGALGRVLERVVLAAPQAVTQTEIAAGSMLSQSKTLSIATVARATGALRRSGLLESVELSDRLRPGRPIVPLRLSSSRWVTVGLHMSFDAGHVRSLFGRVAHLDPDAPTIRVERAAVPLEGIHAADLAEFAAAFVVELLDGLTGDVAHGDAGVQLLGIGIEIGEQVDLDQIVIAADDGVGRVSVAETVSALLTEPLAHLAPHGVTVVVENDANAKAIERTYRHGHPTFALVVVYERGVGGALVNQNRLIRGASGGAGEIGHLDVVLAEGGVIDTDRLCDCGQAGHLDVLGTPDAISHALGDTSWALATRAPLLEEMTLTLEAAAFHQAGTALGRALRALLNLTNPGRLHLLLPRSIATAEAGTAGSAYVAAVDAEISKAFTNAATDARGGHPRLAVEAIGDTDEEVELDGCVAASACVVHALIEHLRGREMCPTSPGSAARVSA